MMFSSNTFRSVLAIAAACNAVTSATEAVDLGTAGDYVILTKSGISTVPDYVITRDIGVSPIAATALTGFSLTMDAGGGRVFDIYSAPKPTRQGIRGDLPPAHSGGFEHSGEQHADYVH
jgi:hypothetical protein